MQVAAKVFIGFVEGHEFFSVHFLGLIQGNKLNVPGRQSLVGEGALDGVQIVCSHGHQGSVSSQVLVQLVLQSNEGFIAVGSELDIAQDGTRDVRADLCGVGQNLDYLSIGVLGFDDAEVGRLYATKEDVEVEGDALEAEHVIAVGSDFDFQLRGFLLAINNGTLLVLGIFVELDAIVEAEVFELFLGKPVCESSNGQSMWACVRRQVGNWKIWRIVARNRKGAQWKKIALAKNTDCRGEGGTKDERRRGRSADGKRHTSCQGPQRVYTCPQRWWAWLDWSLNASDSCASSLDGSDCVDCGRWP